MKPLDPKEIIRTNPLIDPIQLQEAAESWEELKASGIQPGPGFRLGNPYDMIGRERERNRAKRAKQKD